MKINNNREAKEMGTFQSQLRTQSYELARKCWDSFQIPCPTFLSFFSFFGTEVYSLSIPSSLIPSFSGIPKHTRNVADNSMRAVFGYV